MRAGPEIYPHPPLIVPHRTGPIGSRQRLGGVWQVGGSSEKSAQSGRPSQTPAKGRHFPRGQGNPEQLGNTARVGTTGEIREIIKGILLLHQVSSRCCFSNASHKVSAIGVSFQIRAIRFQPGVGVSHKNTRLVN